MAPCTLAAARVLAIIFPHAFAKSRKKRSIRAGQPMRTVDILFGEHAIFNLSNDLQRFILYMPQNVLD